MNCAIRLTRSVPPGSAISQAQVRNTVLDNLLAEQVIVFQHGQPQADMAGRTPLGCFARSKQDLHQIFTNSATHINL